MAQLWKVRVPNSTMLSGLGAPPLPQPRRNPWWPPRMERHEWMALGAVASGGLAIWTYILASRGRSVEAAAVGLLTAISGTVVASVGHLNAPAMAQRSESDMKRIIHEAIAEVQAGQPPPTV